MAYLVINLPGNSANRDVYSSPALHPTPRTLASFELYLQAERETVHPGQAKLAM